MPRNKCAFSIEKIKWPILKESVVNWILENHQNGVIVTRNSICLFALQCTKRIKMKVKTLNNFELA